MKPETKYTPHSPQARIAYETILHHLEHGNTRTLKIDGLPLTLFKVRRACFVSLHLSDGSLRGCIGTLEPVEENLYKEISRNAISAALRDSRFKPLTTSEFANTEISVDVLSDAERITDMADLDPQIYGIIVSDNNNHRAILLPSIEGIDTIEKQFSIVKRKAGLSHAEWDELNIYRFTTTRYY